MGLSLMTLALFRYPFGIMAVVDVIGSIGVSINVAIIILTALQKNARATAGGGFWPPFAMAIAGGVLLSTVVSLSLHRPERTRILAAAE